MNTEHRLPGVGDSSPWGYIDDAKKLADGIVLVGTDDHGGIFLSPAVNAAMPEAFRNTSGWYEEDCEWALVALIYPNAFTANDQASVHKTVKNWMPSAYEAWAGVVLQPGESRTKDEETFLKAHANDWLVVTARGSWDTTVPEGWMGVCAVPGAFYNRRTAETPQRYFLVTKDDYDARSASRGFFLCDPARHPAWDRTKPKSEQVTEVAPTAVEEEEPEGMRP